MLEVTKLAGCACMDLLKDLPTIRPDKMCQQVQGTDGTAAQQQPLVLDLLDANGCHINDSVIHIAWANSNGAFLLAAATKSTIVVLSLLR